jgi:hypothetical protein
LFLKLYQKDQLEWTLERKLQSLSSFSNTPLASSLKVRLKFLLITTLQTNCSEDLEYLKRCPIQYFFSFYKIQHKERTKLLCPFVSCPFDSKSNGKIFNKLAESQSSIRPIQILLVFTLWNQRVNLIKYSLPTDSTSLQQICQVEVRIRRKKMAEELEEIQRQDIPWPIRRLFSINC